MFQKFALAFAVTLAVAPSLGADDDNRGGNRIAATLRPTNEVPAVSSPARGRFSAVIHDDRTITYELSYEGLQAPVLMSHIHFAQRNVNGAIVVWLCGTAVTPANRGPEGTQTCPQSGTITGTITPANIQTVPSQGIATGEFDELEAAIRAGLAYVNVHSVQSPGGEVRGQIRGGERDRD
jgi:hypothetical protein